MVVGAQAHSITPFALLLLHEDGDNDNDDDPWGDPKLPRLVFDTPQTRTQAFFAFLLLSMKNHSGFGSLDRVCSFFVMSCIWVYGWPDLIFWFCCEQFFWMLSETMLWNSKALLQSEESAGILTILCTVMTVVITK
jgi:hypothetical protein